MNSIWRASHWCLLMAVLPGSIRAQESVEVRPENGADREAATAPYIRPVLPVAKREPWLAPRAGHGVDWNALAWQSSLFMGVQHGFRLMTEPGTREGLKGTFLPGWWHAAGNLHGWSDGDPFYVNYIGHPIQGAVTGFIWAQNDLDYRGVEFGRDARYWRSRARAAGYSWAYSTLFEIGPASEASIGKVQSVYPQQGFVDHVITPIVGTGWMIGEDAIDRYVVRWIERRVANPYVLVFARGLLNPSRSFANVMRMKVPWARDTRPGVFTAAHASYLADLEAGRVRRPATEGPVLAGDFGLSTVEVSATFKPVVFSGAGVGVCYGGGGEGAFRLTPSWQLVLAASGCKMTGLGANVSGDMLTYMAGPRWSARPTSRWNPYAQVMLGGIKVTKERIDPELRASLVASAPQRGSSAADDYALYAQTWEANGVALAAGTGVDLRLHPAMALKVANLEYRRSWLPALQGRDFNHGLAFTMAVVLRMGTW